MTWRVEGAPPDEKDQILVETWASGRGESLRQISYAIKDGRRGRKELAMGFDRRGGFLGFDDAPVERSAMNLSEGFQEGKPIRSSGVQRFQVYEKLPRTPVNLAALRPSKER